ELGGAGQQQRVVDVRDHAHRGGMPDLGAVAGQRRGELVGPAVQGEDQTAAGERGREPGGGAHAPGPATAVPTGRTSGSVVPSAPGRSPSSPSRATSPITITAGLRTCASSAARTAPARLVRVVRWRGVWPFARIASVRSPGTPGALVAATRAGTA